MTLFDPGSEAGDEGAAKPEQPGGAPTSRLGASDEADEADEAEGVVRLRLEVAYDGTGFRGFAAQEGQRTVGGELARAIATVVRHDVDLVCAGRTDAGVHASGQVVHVDVRRDAPPERIAKAVNSMLGPHVVVRSVQEAPAGFDARRSARSRSYRYLVHVSQSPHPLLAPMTWHVRDELDLRSMSAGADSLLGEHDFAAFCRRAPGVPKDQPIQRRVLAASWSEVSCDPLLSSERLLRFDIRAQSFCHQMVRSIVGTLVDVGRGRRRASEVVWLLRSADRSRATTVAPPHGLCLMGVEYDGAG